MKRGGRALLGGAIIAAALCSAALAQSTVTLVGINAVQDGNAAVIELHTSGPADFVLDRFTMGQWLTVWSNRFELAGGVKEIPLEFDRAELADMVTGVSLVNDKQAGAVRIYLGTSADMRHASLSHDGDVTRVRIPLKAEAHPKTVAYHSKFAVRSKADMPAGDADADKAQDAKPAAHSRNKRSSKHGAKGGSLADKSFRADSDGTGLLALNSEPAKPLAANAELETKSIAQLMEDTTQLVKANAALPVAPKTTGKGAKAGGEFYRPFQLGMKAVDSNGMYTANAMPVSGKDALRGVRVERFEILDQPLDQALTLLVAPTGFNVIVDSSVGKENVSLSFKDSRVDLRSALDLLTRSYGLEYVVQDGTIVVGSKERLFGGGLMGYDARLFVLSYAQPRSIKQILLQTGLVTSDQIEVYSERVQSGSGSGGGQQGGAAPSGGGQDQAASGGAGSSSGASSSMSSSSPNSGSTGASAQQGGGAAGGTTENLVSTTPQNSIFVKAPPEQMEKIAQVIQSLDRRPQMIEMEVRVCEANEVAIRSLGIGVDPNALATGTTNNSGLSQTWSEANPSGSSATTGGAGRFEAFTTGDFFRSGLNFTATLFHQIESGNLHVLAQPTLTTVEGKTADYFAGDRVPYITQPANNTGASSQAAQVGFIDLGVKLNFTPRIDADQKVTIDVSPEVSTLVRFIDLGGGATAPQSTQRRLHTMVRVGSCEPFVLAGLINDQEKDTVTRIPVLANLPWVGKLFRHTSKDKNRTEIIIVVVPKVKN